MQAGNRYGFPALNFGSSTQYLTLNRGACFVFGAMFEVSHIEVTEAFHIRPFSVNGWFPDCAAASYAAARCRPGVSQESRKRQSQSFTGGS
jgi:hypothetical protein